MRIAHHILRLTAGLTLAAASSLVGQSSTPYTITGDHVVIYDLVGTLHVEAASGADVTVDITRGGRDADKLKISTGELRGHPGLRVIFPDDDLVYPALGRHSNSTLDVRDDGTFGEGGHEYRDGHRVRVRGDGSGTEAWADLRVAVPKGKTVAVHLGVGKATVTNVDGDIRVDLLSADVSTSGTKGTLTINTGSGDVHLKDAAGDVDVETGSGDVTLAGLGNGELKIETGSGNVTADHITAEQVHLETGSGDIRVAQLKSPDITLEAGSGDVEIGLLDDVRELSANTGSGGITLTVPDNLGATLDIDTGSGSIDLGGVTVQVRRIESDHLTGTIGDGHGRIKLEAGSGDVVLRKS
jgi:molybdopterin-binding protein